MFEKSSVFPGGGWSPGNQPAGSEHQRRAVGGAEDERIPGPAKSLPSPCLLSLSVLPGRVTCAASDRLGN